METSNFTFPIPQEQEMCKRESFLPFKHNHVFMNEVQTQAIMSNGWDQDTISKLIVLRNLPELQDRSGNNISWAILNLKTHPLSIEQIQSKKFYMIFLNGFDHHFADTYLPDFDIQIRPERGLLLYWDSATVTPRIHESPDLQEDKYVLVIHTNSHLSSHNQKNLNTNSINSTSELPKISRITNRADLRLFTNKGYEVVKVPQMSWDNIQQNYQNHKNNFSDEYSLDSNSGLEVLFDSDVYAVASETSYISDSLRNQLLIDFLFLAQDWCGEELIPVNTFGFRSFRRGTKTSYSQDKLESNIISILIKVDERSNSSWPISFKDENNNESRTIFDVGSMCFYEGAKLEYGFPERLDGEFSRYLYLHYLPKTLQAQG